MGIRNTTLNLKQTLNHLFLKKYLYRYSINKITQYGNKVVIIIYPTGNRLQIISMNRIIISVVSSYGKND